MDIENNPMRERIWAIWQAYVVLDGCRVALDGYEGWLGALWAEYPGLLLRLLEDNEQGGAYQ
jgi:hypothetical protein